MVVLVVVVVALVVVVVTLAVVVVTLVAVVDILAVVVVGLVVVVVTRVVFVVVGSADVLLPLLSEGSLLPQADSENTIVNIRNKLNAFFIFVSSIK